MGNRMCKKKPDPSSPGAPGEGAVESPIDRIFSRLHLRPPKSWKSDSQLDRNKVNRYEVNPPKEVASSSSKSSPATAVAHSKSFDWTDVTLEAPENFNLKDPQLSFTFDNAKSPTPPPRKHKKTLREKLEGKLRPKKSEDVARLADEEEELPSLSPLPSQPVEEVVCTKKTVIYRCPGCEGREHCPHLPKSHQVLPKSQSVVSLPSFGKLSLSDGGDLQYIDASVANSANSLPGAPASNEKRRASKRLDDYVTRARSFGSLLNGKLRGPAKKTAGHESDEDSFGGLEEWDLGLIEHYNPRDASLPRPPKSTPLAEIENLIIPNEEFAPPPKSTLSQIENLIIPDEQLEKPTLHLAAPSAVSDLDQLILPEEEEVQEPPPVPVRPLRRSESLVKKMQQEQTLPPEVPQSPEHSSLMRILQDLTADSSESSRKGDANQEFLSAERVAAR